MTEPTSINLKIREILDEEFITQKIVFPKIEELLILSVDTSISKTLTLKNVSKVNWGDGNSETVTGNTVTHNYSDTGMFEVILKQLTNFPDNIINNQKNVIAINSKPPMMQVTGIGFAAFNGCSGIAEFNVDLSDITSTPDGIDQNNGAFSSAFDEAANIELTFSNKGFKRIGDWTFMSSKMKSVTFSPDSSIVIGAHAFDTWAGATNLTSLSFGKITKLDTVDSIQKIGNNFAGRGNVTSFNADFSELTVVPQEAFLNALKVGSGIVLNFPNQNFNFIGRRGFCFCGAKEIYFSPNSVIDMSSNSAFYNCAADTIHLGKISAVSQSAPIGISGNSNDFFYCSNLVNFTADFSMITEFPRGNILSGGRAESFFGYSFIPGFVLDFRASGLKATSLSKIGGAAFIGTGASKIYFEKNLTIAIETRAFEGNTYLEEIHMGKILFTHWSSSTVHLGFFNCPALKILDVDMSEVDEFPDGYHDAVTGDIRGLFMSSFAPGTDLDFSETGIKAVNLQKIGIAAFASTGMRSLTFSKTATFSIEREAFYFSAIEILNLGIVKKIDTDAFLGTDHLRIIRIYSTTPPPMNSEIGHSDTSGLHLALESIFVPDGSVSAYQNAPGWSDYSHHPITGLPIIKGFSQDI